MRSLLGVPVMARGQIFGNIYLTEKQGASAFTDEDERALVVLATQAGVAVENARLYEESQRAQSELRRLEVLDERERIAKELHDGVIQSLFAVGMSLQGAAALAHDPGIATRIEGAVEDIDRAIRDLRNYIFGLRPGILADRQLDQALRELGAEFEERSDVVTVVDVDPDGRLRARLGRRPTSCSSRARLCPTWAATRKPPPAASRSGATADRRSWRSTMTGAGSSWAARTGGLGIANLRDRVGSLGGTLDIESRAGEGTAVRASLPL